MTPDPQLTSFGLYLQTARIEKKISIEALAAETRIRVEVLKRLEAEDHEHLANAVFVKGFIRTYANAVGADAEEALERYRTNRALRNVGGVRTTTRSPQPNRFWLVFAAAVGAVLLTAGLTLYVFSRLSASHDEPTVSTPPAAAPLTTTAKVPVAPPTTTAKGPAAAEVTPPPAASAPRVAAPSSEPTSSSKKQFRLDIKAIENTWLKVIIDDQKAEEVFLKSGDTRQIEAQTLFNLLIGNAGGVELQLNGNPVEVSGKSGQVVNIQLP